MAPPPGRSKVHPPPPPLPLPFRELPCCSPLRTRRCCSSNSHLHVAQATPFLPLHTSLAALLQRNSFTEQNQGGLSLCEVEDPVTALQLMVRWGGAAVSSSSAGTLTPLVQLPWFHPAMSPWLLPSPNPSAHAALAATPAQPQGPWPIALAAANPAQDAGGCLLPRSSCPKSSEVPFSSSRAQIKFISWTGESGLGRKKSRAHLQGFGM